MINEKNVKKYYKEDISKIENYDKAVEDDSQMWDCHHILGEILSKEQLEAHEFYYNVPACMLKFVTKAEHHRIHNKDNTYSLGLKRTTEARKKMSEAHKGKKNIFSEDTLKKLSEVHKGRRTKGSSGMHWYNNGVENILTYTCPDGYIKGRLNNVHSNP